jgi:hypothetical protein
VAVPPGDLAGRLDHARRVGTEPDAHAPSLPLPGGGAGGPEAENRVGSR